MKESLRSELGVIEMSVLSDEKERLINALPKTAIGSTEYSRILDAINQIVWLLSEDEMQMSYGVAQEVAKLDHERAKVLAEQEAEVQTEEVVLPESDKTYTQDLSKEAVRDILTEASKKGIKIQPIMTPFIPEGKPVKFSSVPASSYAELIAAITKAEEAIANAE